MQIYSPGTRIGPYEIASNPMIGGMGVVYFCLDHANDSRPVALKTFKPEYLPDRAARDRFLREGAAWVQLGRHPHIVRCYAVEYIDPTAFLSLELIAKEQGMDDASLRPWLGAPMPVERALLFALQIARGMKHATDKIPGFVHRDLKPENILVGADKLPGTNVNRLRVTDFGLAAILKDEIGNLKDEDPQAIGHTHLTRGIVGTPLYMAPEQWKGEPVGVYTDVYALGCILYEMLTGQRAASGRTISELQAAHCAGKLRSLPPSLTGEVVALLKQCLALVPTKRYSDWETVTRMLENAYAAYNGQFAPIEAAPETFNHEKHRQADWSYNAIGRAYADLGKTAVAMGYFEKALTIANETGDQGWKSAALSNLGNVHRDLGEAQRAINYYEQALTIDRNIGDRHGESISLGNLGLAYMDLDDAQRAIEYYEQYLAIASEISDRQGEGNALGNLGSAYLNLGNAQCAISYYEQALVIDQEIGDRRGEGADLGNLGNAYAELGDVRRAISYFEQGLAITREIGDRCGEGNALSNLGIAYYELGDVQRAVGYYEHDLAITRETGDRRGEGKVLNNLAIAHKNLGDMQSTAKYYEQYLTIAREVGDRRGEGAVLGKLGNAYARLGDTRRAIKYYEQALVIRREIGDMDGAANASYNTAMLYVQQGEITCAMPLAQEAAQIWTKMGSPDAQDAQQLVVKLKANNQLL